MPLGISVAIPCPFCIANHPEAAVRQDASRTAPAEIFAIAIYVGFGPSVMYAAQALEAPDQLLAKGGKPR